jgi:hypothetical protein
MRDDPIVTETRRIRDELCAKFNYDAQAIFADLRDRQQVLGKRLVRATKKPVPPAAETTSK